MDLLGGPSGSEEVGSEDGVDVVICEGVTERGGLLEEVHVERSEERGVSYVASTRTQRRKRTYVHSW